MTNLNPTLSFPPMPAGADKNIVKPSASFRRRIFKVIAAIAIFVLTYLVLLAFAAALAVGMGWLGVAIIAEVHQLMVLIFGGALIFAGAMLIFFLIKFIFAKRQPMVTGYEINKDEQQELFVFITRVTDEVGTKYPKHIYLTSEVNASASFNPSFWTMFFPIRKNLNIGLGLVNSLNQSEFKAVLAHEFGHFSQRSMRFGSYVYHLNRALYNLLYDNQGYNNALNSIGRLHAAARLAVMLNVYVIRGMQAILKKVYILINKSHMQLSREMEFHADTIAAYTSGSNNMVSALRRIEVGDLCYQQTINLLDNNFSENRRTANLYELHSWLIKRFAENNRIQTDESGLPMMDKSTASLQFSQVTIDDPWASHPSLDDREANIDTHHFHSKSVNKPAWELFRNAGDLQNMFTDRIYVNLEKQPDVVDNEILKKAYEDTTDKNSYDKKYRGYYDNRRITTFDINELKISSASTTPSYFDVLFSDEHCNLPKKIDALNDDIFKLGAFDTKNADVKAFYYNGTKYHSSDAELVKGYLSADLKKAEVELAELDKAIFLMFYNAADDVQKQELVSHYERVFKYQNDAETDFGNYAEIMNAISPVYRQMKFSEIYDMIDDVYALEKKIKPRITAIIEEKNTRPFVQQKQQEAINKYLSKNWSYFIEPRYDQDALNVFNEALSAYYEIIWRRNFQLKKDLLEFQLTVDHAA